MLSGCARRATYLASRIALCSWIPLRTWFPHTTFHQGTSSACLEASVKKAAIGATTLCLPAKTNRPAKDSFSPGPHVLLLAGFAPGFGEFWFAFYRNTMLEIRHIASGSFQGARPANGAQRKMNFIAGDSWLATNWVASAGVLSALLVEPKACHFPESGRNFVRRGPSPSQKRSINCRKTMGEPEPVLYARQEPA